MCLVIADTTLRNWTARFLPRIVGSVSYPHTSTISIHYSFSLPDCEAGLIGEWTFRLQLGMGLRGGYCAWGDD